MALVVAYMSLVVTIEENTFQFINSCSTISNVLQGLDIY